MNISHCKSRLSILWSRYLSCLPDYNILQELTLQYFFLASYFFHDTSISFQHPSLMTNMPVQSQNGCQFSNGNGQSAGGNGPVYYDSTTSMMSRLQMHQMSPSPQQQGAYDHNQNSNSPFTNSPNQNQQHIDSQVQDYMMDMGLDPNRYINYQSNSSQSLPQNLR